MSIVRELLRGCAAPASSNPSAVGGIFDRTHQWPRDRADCDSVMDPSPRWDDCTLAHGISPLSLSLCFFFVFFISPPSDRGHPWKCRSVPPFLLASILHHAVPHATRRHSYRATNVEFSNLDFFLIPYLPSFVFFFFCFCVLCFLLCFLSFLVFFVSFLISYFSPFSFPIL